MIPMNPALMNNSQIVPRNRGVDVTDKLKKLYFAVSPFPPTIPFTASITVMVDNQPFVINNPSPTQTLNEWLRFRKEFTGTKRMCAEGGCGSCTVMMIETIDGKEEKKSVMSCLVPIASCNGKSIVTIKSLGNVRETLNPVAKRLGEYNGSQCGYCSPGMVMQMYSYLQNNPNPNVQDIEKHLDGNICRCTGYKPILDAFKSFAASSSGEEVAKAQPQTTTTTNCCGQNSVCCKRKPVTFPEHCKRLYIPRILNLTPEWYTVGSTLELSTLISQYPNQTKN